jgi:hypothetical protein
MPARAVSLSLLFLAPVCFASHTPLITNVPGVIAMAVGGASLLYLGARNGSVFVADLSQSPICVSHLLTIPVLITSSLESYHGLTSVSVAPSALLVSFTPPDSAPCADDGRDAVARAAAGGAASVLGCPRAGALARVPLSAGGLIAGAAEIVWRGGCSQFVRVGGSPPHPSRAFESSPPPPPRPPIPPPSAQGSNGVVAVTVSPIDGAVFVATGAGANDASAGAGIDVGQFGAAPCTVAPPWGGQFNALQPLSDAGKVFRFAAPAAGAPFPAPTLHARGLHNPFRLTWARVPARLGAPAPPAPQLFALDTGGAGAQMEELNGPLAGGGESFGWPCALGAGAMAPFQTPALPGSPCALTGGHRAPLYATPVGARRTLSAVEWHPPSQRWVLADAAAGRLFSFSPLNASGWSQAAADQSTTEEARFTYITQLLWVPTGALGAAPVERESGGALLCVDYGRGEVRQVLLNGTNAAAASGGAAAALGGAAALLAAAALALLPLAM